MLILTWIAGKPSKTVHKVIMLQLYSCIVWTILVRLYGCNIMTLFSEYFEFILIILWLYSYNFVYFTILLRRKKNTFYLTAFVLLSLFLAFPEWMNFSLFSAGNVEKNIHELPDSSLSTGTCQLNCLTFFRQQEVKPGSPQGSRNYLW